MLETYLHDVAFGKEKEWYIPCENAKRQETVRVSAYKLKKKFGDLSEEIGITKVEIDGKFYVKIFRKGLDMLRAWKRSPDGELVMDDRLTNEQERYVRLIVQDEGISYEEAKKKVLGNG